MAVVVPRVAVALRYVRKAGGPMKKLTMLRNLPRIAMTFASLLLIAVLLAASPQQSSKQTKTTKAGSDGRSIFRFDTFGDEQLWTDTLQMQKAIATVSPKTALS